MSFAIRPGRADDVSRIFEILNHYVRTTTISFYEEPFDADERLANWFPQFAATGPHRLLVAEDAEHAGRVVGVAWSAPFRPKPAYRTTVETTVYCDPDRRGRGVGRQVYGALLDLLAQEDVRSLMGWIALPNDASERLHQSLGFTRVGTLHDVGRKLGRWCDIAIYERLVASE